MERGWLCRPFDCGDFLRGRRGEVIPFDKAFGRLAGVRRLK